jgi:hypothetical protein
MSELAAALAAQLSSNAAINALLLVMHFLETYLASILYVALPFGSEREQQEIADQQPIDSTGAPPPRPRGYRPGAAASACR